MRSSRRIAIRTILLLLFPLACASAQVQGDPIPGVADHGVELGLDSSGNVGALLVYKGTQVAQQLLVCTPEAVPRDGNVGTIASSDLNFDGFGDLLLQVSAKDRNAVFCVWMFDPDTKQFAPSAALSELVNLTADAGTKTVNSYKRMGCWGSCYDKQTYRWIKGQLTLVRDESVMQNINSPIGPGGGCGYIKSVKELRNGQLTETSREVVNDLGVACMP